MCLKQKREILTFADKVASGLPRPVYKFIHDMIYGFAKNQSGHLSVLPRPYANTKQQRSI